MVSCPGVWTREEGQVAFQLRENESRDIASFGGRHVPQPINIFLSIRWSFFMSLISLCCALIAASRSSTRKPRSGSD